ncbi:hypothetical protein M569_13627, partial [Genlisea aurea]
SLAIVVVFYVFRFLNYAYFQPKKLDKLLRRNGFRGNEYKFLHGDLKEIAKATKAGAGKPVNFEDDFKPRVYGFFLKTINAHGNCSFFWSGTRPTILINDADLVKEILNKPDDYGKPLRTNPLQNLFIRGLVAHEGEKWTKHRRIMNPAFHLEKLKLMVPAFRMSAEEILYKWEGYASPDGSKEYDVWPDIQKITSDAISRTAFGSKYGDGRKIFQLLTEQAANVVKSYQLPYIPGSQYLPTKMNRRMKEIERELQTLISGLIDQRINSMKAGEPMSNDLLGIMLESNFQEMKQNKSKNSGMTLDDIAEECKLFYFGGQETTSILLVWTVILLSRYPEWQDKAREEVLSVFGNQPPHYDGLNQLKIVTMILNEVLRLYPPVPAYGRRAKEEIKLGKYTLPKDATVQLQILLLHHNTKIWGDDALRFNPERFSEGVVKAQKVPGVFFPFGYGARMCIGQSFTMVEARVVLAMMLQKFSFQLSSSYVHAPFATMTIKPQHGAPLILHKL